MAMLFRNLSLRDKLRILGSEDIAHLQGFSDQEIQDLLRETGLPQHYQSIRPTVNETINALLVQEPALPPIMLWGIVGSVTLAVTSLAIITAVTLVLLLVAGAIYGPVTYHDLVKKRKELDDGFKFSALKMRCADDLIHHYQHRLPNVEVHPEELHREFHFNHDNRTTNIKRSAGMGLLIGTTIFGTYYIGVTAVLSAFAFTAAFSALAGPIAIGVALGVAIGIGIYLGYKHYQNLKRDDRTEKLRHEIDGELSDKRRLCDQLECTERTINAMRPAVENKPPAPSPPSPRRTRSSCTLFDNPLPNQPSDKKHDDNSLSVLRRYDFLGPA